MAKNPTKIRKQVYLEPNQELILKRLAKKTGMTEAEIIRQAIDRYTKMIRPTRREMGAWERERTFITRLIKQSSVPGGRSWTREDLHER
jgi:hypothetical protein